MSRRTNRSRKPTGSAKRTDADADAHASSPKTQGPSWLLTCGIAVAAMILTLASARPIYNVATLSINPRGMLAAIQESDYLYLNRRAENPVPGKPTFASILQQYNDSAIRRESVRNYRAVKQARDALATAWKEHRSPSDAELAAAATAAQVDRHNFLSRMLLAAIVEARGREKETSPADRLAELEGVFSAPPVQTTCTTYDDEYRDLLARTFSAAPLRPDVAASMASQWYTSIWEYRSAWFLILPRLAEQFSDLRDALAAEGDASGAASCDRWLARLCVGLIETTNDTAVQCLAADLLAHHQRNNPDVSKPLRDLVDAHTTNMRYHGADWAGQLKSNGEPARPSLAPTEYESAVERLVCYAILLTLAVGAALALVFGLASVVAPTEPASPAASSPSQARFRTLIRWLILLVVPTFFAVLNANLIHEHSSFYAQSLAIAVLHAFIFLTICAILLHAIVAAWPDRSFAERFRRAWPAVLVFVACGVFLTLPNPTAAGLLRKINYAVPQNLWSVAAMLLFMMFAVLLARVPGRQLARSAAGAWLCFAILACIMMRLHVVADRAYQDAIVAAHEDEMAVVVGSDWKSRYIVPVKKAFDPTIP